MDKRGVGNWLRLHAGGGYAAILGDSPSFGKTRERGAKGGGTFLSSWSIGTLVLFLFSGRRIPTFNFIIDQQQYVGDLSVRFSDNFLRMKFVPIF